MPQEEEDSKSFIKRIKATHLPEIIELIRDFLATQNYDTDAMRAAFLAKWGVTHLEARTQYERIKMVMGLTKTAPGEVKELHDWLQRVFEHRKTGGVSEK